MQLWGTSDLELFSLSLLSQHPNWLSCQHYRNQSTFSTPRFLLPSTCTYSFHLLLRNKWAENIHCHRQIVLCFCLVNIVQTSILWPFLMDLGKKNKLLQKGKTDSFQWKEQILPIHEEGKQWLSSLCCQSDYIFSR